MDDEESIELKLSAMPLEKALDIAEHARFGDLQSDADLALVRLANQLDECDSRLGTAVHDLRRAEERLEEVQTMLGMIARFRRVNLDWVVELMGGKDVRGPTRLAVFANAAVQLRDEMDQFRRREPLVQAVLNTADTEYEDSDAWADAVEGAIADARDFR